MIFYRPFAYPLLIAALFALAGCDSIPFMDNTPDYKSGSRGKPLEVPPDLTSASSSDTYSVPGATTYSDFNKGQAQQAEQAEKIVADPTTIKLERAGSQRWLVVQATPEKIWPVVLEFWTDLGFAVTVENPQTGVMETEWTDATDLNKDSKGYLSKFQNWLDKMGALNNRIKFRTRMERGAEKNTVDIYLSHRKFSNVPDDGKVRVKTPYGEVDTGFKQEDIDNVSKEDRAVAEDIDAEMLRRLMVKLGVSEQESRALVSNPNQPKRALLEKDPSGNLNLALIDPFDRAWRRVSLALDRIGFVVEDKDRTRGLFFLRFSDVENEGAQKKKGMLDKLKFWGDDDKPPPAQAEATAVDGEAPAAAGKNNTGKQYRLKLEHTQNGSVLFVTDSNGQRDNSATAGRLLNMLYEQLK